MRKNNLVWVLCTRCHFCTPKKIIVKHTFNRAQKVNKTCDITTCVSRIVPVDVGLWGMWGALLHFEAQLWASRHLSITHWFPYQSMSMFHCYAEAFFWVFVLLIIKISQMFISCNSGHLIELYQGGQAHDTHVIFSHDLHTFCARLNVCLTIILLFLVDCRNNI